jgi:hypothetical protein
MKLRLWKARQYIKLAFWVSLGKIAGIIDKPLTALYRRCMATLEAKK